MRQTAPLPRKSYNVGELIMIYLYCGDYSGWDEYACLSRIKCLIIYYHSLLRCCIIFLFNTNNDDIGEVENPK